MRSIHVSQLVRVDISFDVAVLTIETFYSDDWSSYFSRYMMYFKIRNVKIWGKIMHMKRDLCKRSRSHRGQYLNTDMHKHHSRGECHTHYRMYTYTHLIQLSRWFFDRHESKHNAFISTGNSILRNQHAKATYTSASFFAIVYLKGSHLTCLPSKTSVEIIRCFETHIYCSHTYLGTRICI